MPNEPSLDIIDLYNAAAAIEDPLQCEAFLREQCGKDLASLEKLQEMLKVREEAEQLFKEKNNGPTVSCLPVELAAEFRSDAPHLGRIGNFRIDRLVGRGGMGNVFLGFDERLRRPVALKFPRVDTLDNPQLLERFLQEARLAAQLNHPNLVKIYQVDVWGDACYIASEWCEGGDLARWLAAHPGPQAARWSATLIGAISRAVAYCHRQKIVHLDIKPANIILATTAGASELLDNALHLSGDSLPFIPMLTDFGVARVVEEGLTKTHSSLLMGTPLYMAPEQAECDRQTIGPTSDIFSLGVVLHELLYGERPFDGKSPMQVMEQLRKADTLVIPKLDQVPNALRTICSRCLQHSPKDRYPSADALAEDLDRYLRGEPIHARPVSLRQRLMRWCSRPQRISEAIVCMIVIQVLLSSWVLLGVYLAGQFMSGAALTSARLEMSATIFFISLPLLTLSYLANSGRRWALYAAFFGSLFGQVLVPAVGMLGWIEILGSVYDGQPYFQMINMGLVLFAGITQTFMLGIGMIASRKHSG